MQAYREVDALRMYPWIWSSLRTGAPFPDNLAVSDDQIWASALYCGHATTHLLIQRLLEERSDRLNDDDHRQLGFKLWELERRMDTEIDDPRQAGNYPEVEFNESLALQILEG
ncbi:MAG: hypothetical protein M5U26_11615 [Planctomycetota bacterium]|nr:hypothetical protein [Planctomycetota bacterium]